MSLPPAQPYPLQIRGGPYSFLLRNRFVLAENEPYQAGIKASDGTVYTFWVAGGHDGQNKIIAACGQTCQGEPTIQAPAGCEIYDELNQYKWTSNGWTNGLPADGIDNPIEGMITASNFLGWTAYCPCITGETAASSGFSSTGITDTTGGGGGMVVTPCCPGGVQPTVYLAVTSPWRGNYQLVWNNFLQYWQIPAGTSYTINCGSTPTDLLFGLRCLDGAWQLGVLISNSLPPAFFGSGVAIFEPSSVSCSPFDLAQTNGSPVSGPSNWYCGSSSTLSWSVTD